jgi:hypothetical protein
MTNLHVIEGGLSDTNTVSRFDESDLRAKWRQLSKIEAVLVSWRFGHLPPHDRKVFCAAAGTFALVNCLAWVVALLSAPVSFVIAVACSLAAMYLVNRRDTSPRSHLEHLHQLLGRYQPVSKESFRGLQDKVRERGAIEGDVLVWWLAHERHAIETMGGWRMAPDQAFVNRKI